MQARSGFTESRTQGSSQSLVLPVFQSPVWPLLETCCWSTYQATAKDQGISGLTWSAGSGFDGALCPSDPVFCIPDWLRLCTKRSLGGYFNRDLSLQPGCWWAERSAQRLQAKDCSNAAGTFFYIGFQSSKDQKPSPFSFLSQRVNDDFSKLSCRNGSQAAALLGFRAALLLLSDPQQPWDLHVCSKPHKSQLWDFHIEIWVDLGAATLYISNFLSSFLHKSSHPPDVLSK